jgi:predicted oxidoreductase
MIAGVPDYVDGSMLKITEAAGGRVINPDRVKAAQEAAAALTQ